MNNIEEVFAAILRESFGTQSWQRSGVDEDGDPIPTPEDRKFNRDLYRKMIKFGKEYLKSVWQLVKDIRPDCSISEGYPEQDRLKDPKYDPHRDTIGVYYVINEKGWGLGQMDISDWITKAYEIIEANKDTLGYSYIEKRNYSNSDKICDFSIEFDGDKPSICFCKETDMFYGPAIEINEETKEYNDAFYGLDAEGKRNNNYNKGGYSKDLEDWRLTRNKYRIVFEDEEQPELNFKTKYMSASNAVKEYYSILNENPAYKDAIKQGIIDISIYGQWEQRPTNVENLEAALEKYGKTKAAQDKRVPVEPKKWYYKPE